MRTLYYLILILVVIPISTVLAQSPDTLTITKALALPLPKKYAETVISPNPVEASLAFGKWQSPRAHEQVTFPGYEPVEWIETLTDSSGWFEDSVMNGCYWYGEITLPEAKTLLLAAMGNEMVYVNGAQRSGNPYGLQDSYQSWETHFDYSILPVDLRKGKNEFLVRSARGRFKMKLYPPSKPVFFNGKDMTLPDLLTGSLSDSWGSVVVINSTNTIIGGYSIYATLGDKQTRTPVGVIQPRSVRKVKFRIQSSQLFRKGTAGLSLILTPPVIVQVHPASSSGNEQEDTMTISLKCVDQTDNHRETFISSEDGSVQYYAVNPASDTSSSPKALFLSLHGAAVDAINQSGSYRQKTWGYIVAPTNRRPYGFNWEDWGRLDALQVLDIAESKFPIDRSRVYLTGHSMGGHGTWHLGTLYPDKFAAIGPSAGWVSFWTYRFRGQQVVDTTAVRAMVRRSTTPSETFEHLVNLPPVGVYILHGTDDDNVPVTESRSIVERLKPIHSDFVYHEEPGAGHWWDKSDEPGADCVDWQPMFDYFARHLLPRDREVREIDFSTSNPAISSADHWATIISQRDQLKMSRLHLRYDPGMHRFSGTTNNIASFSIDCVPLDLKDSVSVEVDNQNLRAIPASRLWFARREGKWEFSSEPPADQKGPRRYGTLKEVFKHNVMFVYGTHGTDEENAWAFNKSRYDAEKLWYQGNGSVEVVRDDDIAYLRKHPENRSVVLYGNASTNSAWKTFLNQSPVQVKRGLVSIHNGKRYRGQNLACLLIRPLKGTPEACVAAISGTGITGMKAINRIPYLSPGINLPDCTIFTDDVLTKGDEGVILTGFFGLDWSVENGEFVGGGK